MTAFSDDFNRADSADLGAGWVEVSGEWSIVSQQLSPGAAGGTIILRAATAMAGNDNFAQVTIASVASASRGVWCRGNANITSGYLWRNDGSNWTLFAVVGGSFGSIGSYTAAAASGDVAKVQAVGSTIKGFVNGIERVSVVNTAVTTGTSVGIRSESVGAVRYDNFSAGDVTAGATLSTASSTETALPLAGAKAATLTTAAETAGAQALAGAKNATLTPVAEQGATQNLTGAKAALLASVAEQAAAQDLTGIKTGMLGAAGSTEAAQPLAGIKTATLPPVVEQSTAQALSGVKTGTLTTAETAEAAQPLAPAVTLPAAGAYEAAQPLTGIKTATLPPALELSTARPLTRQSTTRPSPERTLRVPAENRRLVVAAETRKLTVR